MTTFIDSTATDITPIAEAQHYLNQLGATLASAIVGQEEVVRILQLAVALGRPVSLQGPVGTVKSLATKVLARALGLDTARIQCTVDTTPTDFTGYIEPNPFTGEEKFRQGPLFKHVVHIDEATRATPHAFSGVLEAIEEGTVTLNGLSYPVPAGQIVVFTLNPSEHAGTFKLPDAVLDRIAVSAVLGQPSREELMRIARHQFTPLDQVQTVLTAEMVKRIQHWVQKLADTASEESAAFAADLIIRTHKMPGVLSAGASPRSIQILLQTAAALAAIGGDGAVTPRHIVNAAARVLRHRVQPDSEAVYKEQVSEIVFADRVIRGLVGL